MSTCGSRCWLHTSSLNLYTSSPRERQMAHTATQLAVYFLAVFLWAPLLRLFPITLKWIISAFEFIIRENVSFTNEITHSWGSTALKSDRIVTTWVRLCGLKLLVVITQNQLLQRLYCFHFVQNSLLFVCFILWYSLLGKKTITSYYRRAKHYILMFLLTHPHHLSRPPKNMKHVSGLHPWFIFGLQPGGIGVESMPLCFLLLWRFCTNIYQVTNYCTLCAQAYTNTKREHTAALLRSLCVHILVNLFIVCNKCLAKF